MMLSNSKWYFPNLGPSQRSTFAQSATITKAVGVALLPEIHVDYDLMSALEVEFALVVLSRYVVVLET